MDDRREHVRQARAGEASLREAAAKRLVGEDPPATVLDGLRRAAHDDAQVVRLALERVVVHGEDLLVVVLARGGVWDLVEVYELVDENDEAPVAGSHEELREELEVLVPGVVGDAGVDAQLAPRLGLGAKLAAQPLDHARARLIVPFEARAIVEAQDLREVEAADEFLDGGELRRERGLGIRLLAQRRDPAVQHERQSTALGARLGGEVADELAVGGKALALAALEAPLGGEVGVRHHEVVAHRMRADGLQEEALARAIPAYEEAEAGSAVCHEVEVMQERLDLPFAPHRDVGQTDARHDAAFERVDDDRCYALGDPRCVCHVPSSWWKNHSSTRVRLWKGSRRVARKCAVAGLLRGCCAFRGGGRDCPRKGSRGGYGFADGSEVLVGRC